MKPCLSALAAIFAVLQIAAPATRAQNVTAATLHTFDDSTEGDGVTAPVIGTDGNLYTATQHGGADYVGCIVQLSPAGSAAILHTFDAQTEGQFSSPLTVGSDGALYGTTQSYDEAAILYKITNEGTFTMLHQFPANVSPSANALALAADGTLYGTTQSAGVNAGTVYSVSPDGTFNLVHTFTAAEQDAYSYDAALSSGQDGGVYGLTQPDVAHDSSEGPMQYGIFFKVAPGGQYSVLHTFSGAASDGTSNGEARFAQGSGDAFYFVSNSADYPNGEVTRVDLDGNVTIVSVFSAEDYSNISTALTAGGDGNFYGIDADGTFFRLSGDGTTRTDLALAAADTSTPIGGPLVAAGDGSFYGGTESTVFRAVLYTVAKPVVTLSAVKKVIDENGDLGAANVLVKREGADLRSALKVRLAINGSAVNGKNYRHVAAMATIPAGAASVKVKIKALNTGAKKGRKMVILRVEDARDNSYVVGSPDKVTITIKQND